MDHCPNNPKYYKKHSYNLYHKAFSPFEVGIFNRSAKIVTLFEQLLVKVVKLTFNYYHHLILTVLNRKSHKYLQLNVFGRGATIKITITDFFN